MKKIINFLIITLVILLPLVNSRFLNLIGIDFGLTVNGNYEFTKSMFFNIISGLIIFIFFFENINKKIILPNILLFISGILIAATYFSNFPLTSLFGENGKGHGIILFLNLIGLSIVFLNSEKKDLKKYLNYFLYGLFFVIIFGIKEYYFPTFDYGNLSNRAIGTFGHPNFLALYLLIFFPILIKNIKKKKKKIIKNINYGLIFLTIFTILITQSIWGIFLLFGYIIIIGLKENKKKLNKYYLLILILLLIFVLGYIIIDFGLITKLNSFISRFYIWKTTLLGVTSNLQHILVGFGPDTMSYTFDNFKVPELYIFENFGYTSDRPHNLGLNILYHFGIFGFISFLFFIYALYKKSKNISNENIYYLHAIILFFIFTIFNFSSIASYLILIFLLSILFKNNQLRKKNIISYLPFFVIGIIGIFGSSIYFLEENKVYKNKLYIGENTNYQKIILENPEKFTFINFDNYLEICKDLTNKIPSVENYFYCGNSLYKKEKKLAISYYNKGLEKIPNMWDDNSKYYDNYFVKKIFVPERFYSKKFSNLEEILTKIK